MFKKSQLVIALSSLLCAAASQANTPAIIYVYAFNEGKPLADLTIDTDDGRHKISNKDGFIMLLMSASRRKLTLSYEGKVIKTLDLPLTEGEQIQMFVTTYKNNQPALIEIESSVHTTLDESASANQTPKTQNAAETQAKTPIKGVLTGEVLSLETHKPVKNARIIVSGLDKEIKTDAQGHFSLTIPEGDYSVSILHQDFMTQTKDKIVVKAATPTAQVFNLSPSGLELPEHVVIEPHIAGSLASIMEEQMSTSAVASVLGAEQITRSGDSDAAGALRRATGLTLVGGKFAYIRGLGERYSSTLLNGAPIPSPDPTRRVVPLDLFPTNILESIMIQKSYSVERPGEFAGGAIELRTRTVPDEFFFSAQYQMGINDDTTFQKGLRYKGGEFDFIGADDGSREMPSSLSAALANGNVLRPQTTFNPDGFTADQFQTFGRDLSGVWDVNPSTIRPDSRINMALGDKFNYGDFTFGYTTALRWSDAWDTQREHLQEFSVNNGALNQIQDFQMKKTQREVQADGYLGIEARYQENHKFFGNALILRQTLDEARITEGYTDADATDIKRTRLREIENELISGQFGGEHTWTALHNLKTDWMITQASANRYAPNEREYRYDKGQDQLYYFSRRADSNQINFSNLDDSDESYRFDVTLPLEFKNVVSGNLKSGFFIQSKSRESAIRRFGFSALGSDARNQAVLGQQSVEQVLSDQYIGPNGFVLREITRATDNYSASQELLAYYGQADLTLYETLRLTGGVRIEDNNQQVKTFELFNPANKPIASGLVQTDLLPSIAATWLISDKQQIRASYSETLSRPDFRELSPAPFTDPTNDKETIGNPDLQQTTVNSYDLRWEYYFSEDENISFGLFNKDLSNPIEKILLPGPAGLLSLQNAAKANVYGFELEMMKNLNFITPVLEHYYLAANYTWTQSEIELKPENLAAQTTNFRPLEGHSPYIINAQFGYNDPERGITATLLYNRAGARITEVGSLGAPDKYEQPVNQVDFVYRFNVMDHVSINLNAKNLLNESIEVIQGDKTTRSYRRGREFRMGIYVDF